MSGTHERDKHVVSRGGPSSEFVAMVDKTVGVHRDHRMSGARIAIGDFERVADEYISANPEASLAELVKAAVDGASARCRKRWEGHWDNAKVDAP